MSVAFQKNNLPQLSHVSKQEGIKSAPISPPTSPSPLRPPPVSPLMPLNPEALQRDEPALVSPLPLHHSSVFTWMWSFIFLFLLFVCFVFLLVFFFSPLCGPTRQLGSLWPHQQCCESAAAAAAAACSNMHPELPGPRHALSLSLTLSLSLFRSLSRSERERNPSL